MGAKVYSLTKQIKFEAAHHLESWVHSQCHRVHGHSWKLEVSVMAQQLHNNAIIDLEQLGRLMKAKIFDRLDHQHINEVLGEKDPTCEFLAKWAYYELKPVVPYLMSVRVQETETGWATYWEGINEARASANQ